MDVTDPRWTIIVPLFEVKRRSDGRTRPRREACGNRAKRNFMGAFLTEPAFTAPPFV
jgi:hypothetical protein